MMWWIKFKPVRAVALWVATALTVCAIRVLGAETTNEPVQRWPATAIVRFAGSSTLHDFSGQLPAQPFALVISNRTWSAEADVSAGLMATDNAKRDRKMHEMMNTNAYPSLHGTVRAALIPGSSGGTATLSLKIRDREFELPVRVTAWEETAAGIRFHAAGELSLKQYGLKPPSVAGVIRVSDRVQLEGDVTATKNPAPTETPILKQ